MRSHRHALTLAELLVAVTIMVLLLGLLLVAGRAVQNSIKRSRAQAQLQLLARAMERYAEAWPAWCCDLNGKPVSDAAWPHWSAAAVFDTSQGWSSYAGFNVDRTRILADDDDDGGTGRGDILSSNETLAYSLTAAVPGGNPLIQVADVAVDGSVPPEIYPDPTGAARGVRRRRLYDPWGAPYRYLWVARDSQSYAGWRAITSADPTQAADPSADPDDPFFWTAQGFVIESAGSDGLFGNVWKRSPTEPERRNAEDNLTIRP